MVKTNKDGVQWREHQRREAEKGVKKREKEAFCTLHKISSLLRVFKISVLGTCQDVRGCGLLQGVGARPRLSLRLRMRRRSLSPCRQLAACNDRQQGGQRQARPIEREKHGTEERRFQKQQRTTATSHLTRRLLPNAGLPHCWSVCVRVCAPRVAQH